MLSAVAARWLLVLHAVLGAALVAAATHWLVWLWRTLRGQPGRIRAVRKFAVITMALYVAAMVAGLVVYPTYKARVKLEYLVHSAVVGADARSRVETAEDLGARIQGRPARELGPGALAVIERDASRRAVRIARWFDVKEHWVAVGLALGVAAMALVFAWDPRRDGRGPGGFTLAAVGGTAAITWLAAIVGLVTAATRSF